MRKRNLLSLLLGATVAAGNVCNADAQTFYKKYVYAEDFHNDAQPSRWVANTTNGANNNPTVYGGAGSVAWANGKVTASGAGGGSRGAELEFPTPQSIAETAGYATVGLSFDWTITSASLGIRNAFALTLLDSSRRKDNPLPIAGIFLVNNVADDGKFHIWNLEDTTALTAAGVPYPMTATADVRKDMWQALLFSASSSASGSFQRAGLDAADVTTINASTATTATYTAGGTYHVEVELNFTTKKVERLSITDVADPTNTAEVVDLPFIDQNADSVGVVSFVNTRGSNAGNGNNAGFDTSLDDFGIYVLKLSVGQAPVTVNTVDQNGVVVKTRTAANQEVTDIYRIKVEDRYSFTDDAGDYYYAYDAVATTPAGEEVEVAAGGSTITLKFKKTAVTNGEYVWTGAGSASWDELAENFSVAGASAIGYQRGNAVLFDDAAAANKEITVDGTIDLGDEDVTIAADGYALCGTGKLTGEGKLVLKPGAEGEATVAIPNQLTKGAEVLSGTAVFETPTIGNLKVGNDTRIVLAPNAAFGSSIEGEDTGGEITIEAKTNNVYSSAISGVEKVNLVLWQMGRNPGGVYSSAWTGTFPEGAQVNVTRASDGSDTVRFAVQNIQTAKVNLGDSISLTRHAQETSGGLDTLKVGELSGTAQSFIEGGFVAGRRETYAFGYLNTDATFAGSIRPYSSALNGTGTNELNLVKVGTGTWILSGNSPDFDGATFNVAEGTLKLAGVLGQASAATNVDVRAGATLQGDGGTLGAATGSVTTIHTGATLEGEITIEGGLYVADAATIKLNAGDFTNHDVIAVKGDATFDGNGILDITVEGTIAEGTKAKLFDLADYAQLELAFATVLVNGVDITDPTSGFEWHANTGELEATAGEGPGSAIPTITKDIQSILYYNVVGVRITEKTPGVQIRKITYTDGTVEIVKTFVKE